MKNYEKYKDKLLLAAKNEHNDNFSCENIWEISGACSASEMILWLYEEYKETILSDEEREYLKTIIEPFKDRVNEIVKLGGERLTAIRIFYQDKDNDEDCFDIPLFHLSFENMSMYRHYSLKDLGLEEK